MYLVAVCRNSQFQLSSIIIEAVPTFSSSASISTVTLELQTQIENATAALPPAHRRAPVKGELVESLDARYIWLQDWAFTHRFALVIESANVERTTYRCAHHQKKTWNSRKTEEGDRKRV
jgi:hypothetical protein